MRDFPPGIVETEVQIAAIRIYFFNVHHKGAYFYRIDQGSDGHIRLAVCLDDRNIAPIDLHTNDLWADTVEEFIRDLDPDLAASLLSTFADWDIRFEWRARRDVPRPGSNDPLRAARSWLDCIADRSTRGRIRVRGYEGYVPDIVRMQLDLTIGLIPVLGDIVEVGEFVLALSTGRDRWGNRVTGDDLLLMGLGALLPLVPSGLRHLPKITEGAQRLRELGINQLEEVAELVRRRRPRLTATLAHINAGDLENLGRALADAREARRTIGLTGVRDNALARLLEL